MLYKANFLQELLKNNDRKKFQKCNCRLRYIDNAISLNSCLFGDYQHLIYPNQVNFTMRSTKDED